MSAIDERTARITSTLIDHIGRVELRVHDIERSLGFYRDVVGLEVLAQHAEGVSLGSPGGPEILRVTASGVTAPAHPGSTGLFHVAIRFPTRAALGDALARLVDAGSRIGAGDHAVSEALYIDDPDGNGVELYWDRPVEEWPAPTNDMMVPMVTLPVDLENLLADGGGRDAVGSPAAAGTDIGHVHLQVSELDQTTRFYAEELGLDLVARMGAQAGFFSSNGYHHHIGANTWNSRGGSAPDRHHAGLERVVFAVADADRLEHVRLRLEEHGRSVTGEEGKSLVVRDPDGIELHFIVT